MASAGTVAVCSRARDGPAQRLPGGRARHRADPGVVDPDDDGVAGREHGRRTERTQHEGVPPGRSRCPADEHAAQPVAQHGPGHRTAVGGGDLPRGAGRPGLHGAPVELHLQIADAGGEPQCGDAGVGLGEHQRRDAGAEQETLVDVHVPAVRVERRGQLQPRDVRPGAAGRQARRLEDGTARPGERVRREVRARRRGRGGRPGSGRARAGGAGRRGRRRTPRTRAGHRRGAVGTGTATEGERDQGREHHDGTGDERRPGDRSPSGLRRRCRCRVDVRLGRRRCGASASATSADPGGAEVTGARVEGAGGRPSSVARRALSASRSSPASAAWSSSPGGTADAEAAGRRVDRSTGPSSASSPARLPPGVLSSGTSAP